MNSTSVPSVIENTLKMWTFSLQTTHCSPSGRSGTCLPAKVTSLTWSNRWTRLSRFVVIVIVALFCVGGVVVFNAASQFARLAKRSWWVTVPRAPPGTWSSVGAIIAGRNAAMASELGSMVVTDQVDVRASSIDPIRKLMTPRVLLRS